MSFIDAIRTIDDRPAHQIAVDLINHATATQDGYAARDVLAHNGCRELLTDAQARELSDLVEACALGHGTVPAALLADLTTALAAVEKVMTRSTTVIAPAISHNAHAPASP